MLICIYDFRLRNNKTLVSLGLTAVLCMYILINSKGPHHDVVQAVYIKLLWCLYWIGLGKNLNRRLCIRENIINSTF